MKTVDSRLNGKLGFYQKGNKEFANISFHAPSGDYITQFGYVRPNGQVRERHGVNIVKQAGNVLNSIEKLLADGYALTEMPTGLKIRSYEEVKADKETKDSKVATAPTKPVVEKPKDLTTVPRIEFVAGKTVKIAKQVVPVREGTFDHVPMTNKAYFFPEHTNDVILDMLEKRPLLLTGHTGCGKTSLIEQIAARMNQSMVRSNMNGQTTVGDFVGMWTVKGGETVWVDGVLPRAMKEGHWLVIDEIDCADAAILATLNAVLEKNGVLTLKEKGFEVVKPHENFRLFATANTVGCMAAFRSLYQGTNIMNEAFLDRFRVYHAAYLPEKEETKVVMATVNGLNSDTAVLMVKVANMVRDAFQKEEITSTFSTRRLIDWAEMFMRNGNMKKAAQNVIYSKISTEDSKVIEGYLSRLVK
jgi:cobaltochelatase CobS